MQQARGTSMFAMLEEEDTADYAQYWCWGYRANPSLRSKKSRAIHTVIKVVKTTLLLFCCVFPNM